MKKLLFVMLAAFVCVSCSKDESDLVPNDGQYIARSGDMVVCMQLKGGRCPYFAPYIKGRIFHSWTNVTTSGSYPAYTYSIKDFTVQARYSSLDAFTATLSGVLHTEESDALNTGQSLYIGVPASMQFNLDNSVLDANGDGVLDSQQ